MCLSNLLTQIQNWNFFSIHSLVEKLFYIQQTWYCKDGLKFL